MIYKKQFRQLPYDIKKRTIFRFLFLFFGEILVNKLLAPYGPSIAILPFCWLIFTKKYFNFYVGLGLFGVGFVSYFCFYHFTFFQFLSTAMAMFYIAHFTDMDKISALLAFFIQNFLFIFFDFDFNFSALIQSSLLSSIGIVFVNVDLVFQNTRQRETVFL